MTPIRVLRPVLTGLLVSAALACAMVLRGGPHAFERITSANYAELSWLFVGCVLLVLPILVGYLVGAWSAEHQRPLRQRVVLTTIGTSMLAWAGQIANALRFGTDSNFVPAALLVVSIPYLLIMGLVSVCMVIYLERIWPDERHRRILAILTRVVCGVIVLFSALELLAAKI